MTLSLSVRVAGVSLNPIIVYCGSQEEMDLWFGLLKDNIEANGGTAMAPRNHTRVKVGSSLHRHIYTTLTLGSFFFHGGWRKLTLRSI